MNKMLLNILLLLLGLYYFILFIYEILVLKNCSAFNNCIDSTYGFMITILTTFLISINLIDIIRTFYNLFISNNIKYRKLFSIQSYQFAIKLWALCVVGTNYKNLPYEYTRVFILESILFIVLTTSFIIQMIIFCYFEYKNIQIEKPTYDEIENVSIEIP